MRRKVYLAVLLAAGLSACGGGGGPDPVAPDVPLTLAETAPSLAKTVASVIVAALEGSSSAANASAPTPALARLFASFAPTLHAQAAFTRPCPGGGSVRIERVTMSSGRYTMSAAPATFVGCSFNPGRKAAIANGSIALSGVWCPGQSSCSGPSIADATMPVGITGNLSVSDVGTVPLGGSIGLTAYAIPITGAGIQNGKPDTPPPPNPNSCPATVSPSSVSAGASGGGFSVNVTVGDTCPWTAASGSGFIAVTGGASGRGNGTVSFSVAANTGAARIGSLSVAGQTVSVSQAAGQTPSTLNLTGTWTETITGSAQSNGSGRATLTQSGSTITGQTLGLPGEVSDSITGTISGSNVAITEVEKYATSMSGVSVTCTVTVHESLVASSNTSMSGTFTLSGSCVISAPIPVPPINVSDSGRISFAR